MTSLFKPHTLDEHTDSLASFLPGGCVFESKFSEGSNLRKTLQGLSGELRRIEDTLIQFTDQYDPSTTTSFITEWEAMVGIPDGCFLGTGDIETRRKHVVAKAARALGVSTEQDFIDLADFLGFTINIERPLGGSFNPPYDVPFNLVYGEEQRRFIVIFVGEGIFPEVPPYDVPFTPPASAGSIIPCFFDTLKPANVLFQYANAPPAGVRYRGTEDLKLRVTENFIYRILET